MKPAQASASSPPRGNRVAALGRGTAAASTACPLMAAPGWGAGPVGAWGHGGQGRRTWRCREVRERHGRPRAPGETAGWRSAHSGAGRPQSASRRPCKVFGSHRPARTTVLRVDAAASRPGSAADRYSARFPPRASAHVRPRQSRQPADLRAGGRHPQLRRDRPHARHFRLGGRQDRVPAGAGTGRAAVPPQHPQHHPHRRGRALPGALPAHPR